MMMIVVLSWIMFGNFSNFMFRCFVEKVDFHRVIFVPLFRQLIVIFKGKEHFDLSGCYFWVLNFILKLAVSLSLVSGSKSKQINYFSF